MPPADGRPGAAPGWQPRTAPRTLPAAGKPGLVVAAIVVTELGRRPPGTAADGRLLLRRQHPDQ